MASIDVVAAVNGDLCDFGPVFSFKGRYFVDYEYPCWLASAVPTGFLFGRIFNL